MPVPKTLSSGRIVGLPVRNLQGDHLGTIHDLRIDLLSGRLAYAVLATDSPEPERKYFAIPWSSFQIDPEAGSLRLDADRNRLEASPGLTQQRWAVQDEPAWHDQVHRYFGVKPYWESTEHYTA